MNIMDKHQEYELKLKTRIGKIKIYLSANIDSPTSFSGTATAMGITIPIQGAFDGSGHYSFPASANLPIGSYEVQVEVDTYSNWQMNGIISLNEKRFWHLDGVRVK